MSAESPTLIEEARSLLHTAMREPNAPATNMVIDALVAVLDHLEGPVAVDRESVLSDPKAIAVRHGVDVTRLLNALEGAREGAGKHSVPLDNNEALFVLDLLTVLGAE